MRRTLTGMALGLVLPLGMAHASIESDLKSAQPMQAIFTNALASNISAEAALKQIIERAPDQAYAAITAAIQLNPDQAANIVSAALGRQYNLNPAQVVAAALQGAPDKAGIIVPTAIVKSPSYYTVPIVQRALAEGVDGAKFVPQAMRTSPRQSATILTQALRAAPQQTKAIMEAVIADQPDKAVEYVKIALDAKASALDVLTAAFKVAPRQAESIAAVAADKGISSQLIADASAAAGIEIAGVTRSKGPVARQGTIILMPLTPPGAGGNGGGGCDRKVASCS
ncbi:MAG: hypothetical protein PSX71_04035 [bacterium]|nr:hypothetical protein [bacterium]